MLAYEMGLKPDEVKELTLGEFNIMYAAYRRRGEKDWDIARRTWAYIMTYGGLGLKDKNHKIKPEDLYPLPFTDFRENSVRKITSMDQARKLLNEF